MAHKANGKLRLVINRSTPGQVVVWDEERSLSISPNANTDKAGFPEVRRASLQPIVEAGSNLGGATQLFKGSRAGGTRCLKDGFRRLLVRAGEM